MRLTCGWKYETLRLYGPSPPLPRSPFPAGSNPVIPISDLKGKESTAHITLPSNTQLMLNSWASHTSATHFYDPLTWVPKRWIQAHDVSSNEHVSAEHRAAEELKHPVNGSGFFAW